LFDGGEERRGGNRGGNCWGVGLDVFGCGGDRPPVVDAEGVADGDEEEAIDGFSFEEIVNGCPRTHLVLALESTLGQLLMLECCFSTFKPLSRGGDGSRRHCGWLKRNAGGDGKRLA
jgi:hypothetical protein